MYIFTVRHANKTYEFGRMIRTGCESGLLCLAPTNKTGTDLSKIYKSRRGRIGKVGEEGPPESVERLEAGLEPF
jgi:hypothetical protein